MGGFKFWVGVGVGVGVGAGVGVGVGVSVGVLLIWYGFNPKLEMNFLSGVV